jgi:hypothetical protein
MMSSTDVKQATRHLGVEDFLSKTRAMLIDGEAVSAMSGRTFASLDP